MILPAPRGAQYFLLLSLPSVLPEGIRPPVLFPFPRLVSKTCPSASRRRVRMTISPPDTSCQHQNQTFFTFFYKSFFKIDAKIRR